MLRPVSSWFTYPQLAGEGACGCVRRRKVTLMDDLARQRELQLQRDELLSTPNCPRCLHQMEPSGGKPVWLCLVCGSEKVSH